MAQNWAGHIETLRTRLTEDINLIRFGNGFYRPCAAALREIGVRLRPESAHAN